MRTTIHFVRHGSVANPDNILYGRLPNFSLSPHGMKEAQNTAAYFKDIKLHAIYCSPMLRAQQTAKEIHAFQHFTPVRMSEKLNEVLTPYQGKRMGDLKSLNEDFYTGTQKSFEQPQDIVHRVNEFILEIRAAKNLQEVAAVTHGDIIVFLVLEKRGMDVIPENKIRLTRAGLRDNYPAPASITTLTYAGASADEKPSIQYISAAQLGS